MRVLLVMLAVMVGQLVSVSANAQVLRLKNGNVLHGEVEQDNGQEIVVNIPGVGKMTFGKDEVDSIDEPVHENPPADGEPEPTKPHLTTKTTRERFGLIGHVQEMRIYKAELSKKFGESVEDTKRLDAVYTFDRWGRAVKAGEYDTLGNVERTFSFTYDDQGNETGGVAHETGGRVQRRFVFTFDLAGNLAAESWYDNRGTLLSGYIYSYDDEGRETEEVDAWSKMRSVFTLDGQGNRTRQERYREDGTHSSTETYAYEAFDSVGNWTKRKVEETLWATLHGVAYEPPEVEYRVITYFKQTNDDAAQSQPTAFVHDLSNQSPSDEKLESSLRQTTAQAYGQKMESVMQELAVLNKEVVQSSTALSSGTGSAALASETFGRCQARVTSLRQELDQLMPPAEFVSAHGFILQALGKSAEACRVFKLGVDTQDAALYNTATSYQREANRLLEAALRALPSR